MAAGKSRVIHRSIGGPTRFPHPLSDDYTRESTRLLCVFDRLQDYIKNTTARVLYLCTIRKLSIFFLKEGVPHTTQHPEDITKCWGSKRRKVMAHNAGARQVFTKIGHPYIFKKKTLHTTWQLSVFEKTGHLVWIFLWP